MKKTRRWLAMLLAVVLVSSNVIYQLGTNMSASESDSTTEAQQQDNSAEEKAQQEAASNAHKKDSGEAKVQEVNTGKIRILRTLPRRLRLQKRLRKSRSRQQRKQILQRKQTLQRKQMQAPAIQRKIPRRKPIKLQSRNPNWMAVILKHGALTERKRLLLTQTANI